MRVLFYNTRLDSLTRWGGDTTQLTETQRELEKLGVRVVCNQERLPDLDGYDIVHIFNLQLAENGVELAQRAKSRGLGVALSSIFWDFSYIARSPESMLFSDDAVVRALARISSSVGFLYTRLRTRLGRRTRRLLRAQRRLLEIADVVLPNSYAELEILVQQFRIPQLRAKAFVVPNGVTVSEEDGSKLHDYWPELPDRYVLQAGSCHPVKGQAKVIRALLSDRDVPIVFVGANWDETRYGRWCQQIGKERGNTFFIGKVRHDLMPVLYSHAVVHVLPSLRESPGLASLEAAIYGANCVVSIHCPVAEYFGNDAFVCDPDDLRSIRDAVLQAWTHLPISALRSRIVSLFTWRRAAECTYHGYKQCRVLI